MMPEDSVYGGWPRSGEIDLLESRGNDPAVYGPGGRTMAISTIHWGLSYDTDMFSQTSSTFYKRRGDWSQDFHIYGLEWSEKYLYTYIDNRLLQVLSTTFGGENMWARSGLGSTGYS
jgi:beta-glucanase (GH16 family)